MKLKEPYRKRLNYLLRFFALFVSASVINFIMILDNSRFVATSIRQAVELGVSMALFEAPVFWIASLYLHPYVPAKKERTLADLDNLPMDEI